MCLKRLFCRHRKLTGISAFIDKTQYRYGENFTSVGYNEPMIILLCDRCKKWVWMPLSDMQVAMHNFQIEVDTTILEQYEFFGGKTKVV